METEWQTMWGSDQTAPLGAVRGAVSSGFTFTMFAYACLSEKIDSLKYFFNMNNDLKIQ